jgi:class 3 adenylate cyclase
LSSVTLTAVRSEVERTSIENIVASVQRPAGRAGPTEREFRAILFSDIVDSTASNREVGDEVWQQLRGQHDAIIRDALAAAGGHEVKHLGDGFLCTFPLARDAVVCAINIQRSLAEFRARHESDSGRKLRVRIGIHAAEVDIDGKDIHGTEVNVASRVAGEALGSEILISDSTRQVMGGVTGLSFAESRRFLPKGESEELTVHPVVWVPIP